jgi:hypothetical protein
VRFDGLVHYVQVVNYGFAGRQLHALCDFDLSLEVGSHHAFPLGYVAKDNVNLSSDTLTCMRCARW